MMDITTRNFFRLLRAGAFAETEQIEPMSAWKWQRVYQFSVMHGVTALLSDGIERCKDQFFLQIPLPLLEQWKKTVIEIEKDNERTNLRLTELFALFSRMQLRPVLLKGQGLAILYDRPSHRVSEGIDFFFPFETQGKKADQWGWDQGTNANDHSSLHYEWQMVKVCHQHRLLRLSNRLHGRTLQNITEKEFRECPATFATIDGMRIELLSPTLTLLYLLLRIAAYLLNNGVSLSHLTDLGIYLRKAGDKVDYVKLQSWIERLHMKRMAQLTGELLVKLLAFSREEIPFMSKNVNSDIDKIMNELFKQKVSHEWHFQQAGDIFVHTANSSAMFWQMRHSARYFRYYPSESATNLLSSFAHSLSHIEE